MNKIILLILLLLIPYSAYCVPVENLYTLTHFDKCNNLNISVFGEYVIDVGEYSLVDCVSTDTDEWYCDCHDDYDLILNTTPLTYNTYTFYILRNYDTEQVITHSSFGLSPNIVYCILPINSSIETDLYKNIEKQFRFNNTPFHITYLGDGNISQPTTMYVDDERIDLNITGINNRYITMTITHNTTEQTISIIPPEDMIVVNDTEVIPEHNLTNVTENLSVELYVELDTRPENEKDEGWLTRIYQYMMDWCSHVWDLL